MIRKINHIRDFGLFRDFTWGQLQEFKRYNLIYGWNYSGKTTLSRVFQTLQNGYVSNDFFGCQFEVAFDDGSTVGTHALTPQPKVRVFNRAFIEENFHSEMAGAKIIVVVGAENQKLKKRFGDLERRRAKTFEIKARFEAKAAEVESDLNNSAKRDATIISNLFGIGRYYNALIKFQGALPLHLSLLANNSCKASAHSGRNVRRSKYGSQAFGNIFGLSLSEFRQTCVA